MLGVLLSTRLLSLPPFVKPILPASATPWLSDYSL